MRRRQNRARVDQRARTERAGDEGRNGKENAYHVGKLVVAVNDISGSELIIDGDRAGGIASQQGDRGGPAQQKR
jgi:DNA gyrase/topoisomerase IV subunit B